MFRDGIPMLSSNDVRNRLIVSPDTAPHGPLVMLLGSPRGLMNVVLLRVVRRAMLVAECFEDHATVQHGESPLTCLHLKV